MTAIAANDPYAARLAQAQSAAPSGSAAGAASASATDTAAGTEDRFLKLLVAQMRNQDPLNPMDNAQVTTQLAQINTVRGIETLNASVARLVERGDRTSAFDSVGALGRQVLVAGDSFERGEDAASIRLGVELAAPARRAIAEIVDPSGAVVFSRPFESPAAGVSTFDWNGRLADGSAAAPGAYRLRVSAVSASGQSVASTALSPARVIGVAQDASGVRLELSGRPSVTPAAVKAIL